MQNIMPYSKVIDHGFSKDQVDFLNSAIKGSWKKNQKNLVDVDGDFSYSDRGINDFFGISFGHVKGNFDCSGNNIKSLKGSPVRVDGNFSCASNYLDSLYFSPRVVGGSFNCTGNRIKKLSGSPDRVEGDFYCCENLLENIKGSPLYVGGDFHCTHNNIKEFREYPNSKGNVFCKGNPHGGFLLEKE